MPLGQLSLLVYPLHPWEMVRVRSGGIDDHMAEILILNIHAGSQRQPSLSSQMIASPSPATPDTP